MRLAQIARKLKVKSTDIAAFIEQNFDTQIINAPNTKIPNEYIEKIVEHYAPKTSKELEGEALVLQNQIDEITSSETINDEVKIAGNEELASTDENNFSLEGLNIQDGVIKAPKIEIEGVKVVGKIDLPSEEIKKEVEEPEEALANDIETAENGTVELEAEKKKVVFTPNQTTKKKKRKPKQAQTLTYEEEISVAQQAYKNELKKKREREKEIRRLNYERMMAERSNKRPAKKKKKVSAAKVNQTKRTAAKKEAPKTLWGKFIYWLNH